MAIIYNNYKRSVDSTWYDSSNIIFSACFDTNSDKKSVKVVFKGGRCYLYKEVDVEDYILAKMNESTGSGFSQYIVKKYKSVRLPDVSLEELEKLKQSTQEEEETLLEEKVSNLSYNLHLNKETQEFQLMLNDKVIFEGVENNFSIVRLLKSMNIRYGVEELNTPLLTEQTFEENDLL